MTQPFKPAEVLEVNSALHMKTASTQIKGFFGYQSFIILWSDSNKCCLDLRLSLKLCSFNCGLVITEALTCMCCGVFGRNKQSPRSQRRRRKQRKQRLMTATAE